MSDSPFAKRWVVKMIRMNRAERAAWPSGDVRPTKCGDMNRTECEMSCDCLPARCACISRGASVVDEGYVRKTVH